MKIILMACLTVLSVLCMASQSRSESSSANYAVKAASLSPGAGAMSSGNYSTRVSIGSVTGTTSSANYATVIGFLTPATTDNAPPANAAFASAPGDPDNQTSVTFTVTLPGDAAWYKYRLDDTAWSAPIDAGTTSFTVSGLSDGAHAVRVITADALGNWQAADAGVTHAWTVDTAPPAKTLLSGLPPDRTRSDSTDIAIVGSNVSEYRYSLDGGGFVGPIAAATHLTLSGLSQGRHTIAFQVRDMAGNWQTTTTTVSFTVDASTPDLLIPGTGQTECFNSMGPISRPQPGEDFYGQDGDFTGPAHPLTDQNDGTVRDGVTGLFWQRTPDGQYTFAGAESHCAALELAGYDDWRLPTARELLTIQVLDGANGVLPDVLTGDVTAGKTYWSATPLATDALAAWSVGFYNGIARFEAKTLSQPVRCVRGTTIPTPALADGDDGTVTDQTTGLAWEKTPSASSMKWENALAYCTAQTTGGYADWRLPDRNELASLLDYSVNPPASGLLSNPGEEWTGSTRIDNSSYATTINLSNGQVTSSNDSKTGWNRVRCVRGGPKGTPTLAAFEAGAVSSPASGAIWPFFQHQAVTWNATRIAGTTVDVFLLDDAADIDDADPDPAVVAAKIRHRAAAIIDNAGTLTVSPQKLGASGADHKILVVASDGTWGLSAGTLSLQAALPQATISGAPSGQTRQTTVTATIGGDDATSYKYRFDGGAWSAERDIATPVSLTDLIDGTHTLEVIAGAGDAWQPEASPTTATWTVDATAPAAELTGAPTGTVNTTLAAITVGGDGVAAYRYKLDEGEWSAERAVSEQILLSGLSEGSHTLYIVVGDAIGNWQSTDAPTSHAWTIDLTAPAAPTIPAGPNPATRSTAKPVLSWSAVTGAASYVLQISDTADFSTLHLSRTVAGTGHALTAGEALPRRGRWYWRVRAVDAAGNQGEWVAASFMYAFGTSGAPGLLLLR